jgi:hypothetical protein
MKACIVNIRTGSKEPIIVTQETEIMNRLKAQGDIRSSSIDRNYIGVVFTGPMDNAIAQARAMPEHPIPNKAAAKRAGVSLARYELLSYMRLV